MAIDVVERYSGIRISMYWRAGARVMIYSSPDVLDKMEDVLCCSRICFGSAPEHSYDISYTLQERLPT